MRRSGGRRDLLQGPRTQGCDRHSHTERSASKVSDNVIVSKAVDGVYEMRPLPEWIGAVCAYPDLQREFDRAHGDRPTGSLQVPCERSCKEYCRRPDQWCVDDLEVVMVKGEGALGRGRQRTEPQALARIGLVLGSVRRATADLRRHEPPVSD